MLSQLGAVAGLPSVAVVSTLVLVRLSPPSIPISTFEKIDRALRGRGRTYDIGKEHFLDNSGNVIRNNDCLLALVPGITLDHLVSYMDHKYDTTPRR
jgi:hypothetical protein